MEISMIGSHVRKKGSLDVTPEVKKEWKERLVHISFKNVPTVM